MPQPNSTHVVERREIPSLSLRAAVVPESINIEARTVDVVWTTGARVLRGFWDQFYEELSLDPGAVRMERLNNGAPFLDSHQAWSMRSVIGVVVPGSAKLANGKGTATVRFAKAEDDAEADKIWRKVVDGIARKVSVGYDVYRYAPDRLEEGSRIPVRMAIDWEPFEISSVPMGADDGAGYRAADQRRHLCEFQTRAPHQESDPCRIPLRIRLPPMTLHALLPLPNKHARPSASVAIRSESRCVPRSTGAQAEATTLEDEALRAGTAVDQVRATVQVDTAPLTPLAASYGTFTATLTGVSGSVTAPATYLDIGGMIF